MTSRVVNTIFSVVLVSCLTQCCYCQNVPTQITSNFSGSIDESTIPSDYKFFLRNIFSKYGNDGLMTFEGFEHLLESLGLLFIKDHDLKDHREGQTFLDTHKDHDHPKSNGKSEETLLHSSSPQAYNISLQNHYSAPNENFKSAENFNVTSLMEIFSELNNHDSGMKKTSCLSPKEMYMSFNMDPGKSLNPITFLVICPAIIYELDQCSKEMIDHESHTVGALQYVYAIFAVFIISLCGLCGVALIPIMQKWFYNTLLQFLVGLAVGSLSADALLHLLPHAMMSGNHDEGSSHESHESDMRAVWIGLCALIGIYFFFIFERIVSAIRAVRQQKKELRNQLRAVAQLGPNGQNNREVKNVENGAGKNLLPFKPNAHGTKSCPDAIESIQMLPNPPADVSTSRQGSFCSRRSSAHEIGFHGRTSFSSTNLAHHHPSDPEPDNCIITLPDHHGHSHGHCHKVFSSMSSVALMVILGDGVHNFCDGIAIGVAFATGLGDGISTSVAVFCHELPHELGDFGMLLKTGMTVKLAIMYNLVSSVLCLFGMFIGLSLGNYPEASSWIFAVTAGMFLYIALVDMLPELVTSTDDPGNTVFFTLGVQCLGITVGACILLMIAIFESKLQNMF